MILGPVFFETPCRSNWSNANFQVIKSVNIKDYNDQSHVQTCHTQYNHKWGKAISYLRYHKPGEYSV